MVSIPGYKIGKLIGKGGISEVFEAWNIQDERLVALKIIQDKFRHDHMLRTRLLREAQIIGTLKHRNLVQIFKFGTIDDRFYSIMEFLSLGSLAEYQQWTPRQLLKAMIQVCDGLVFVHKNNIIHRDLKPSNIMFGGDGIPRLVDFGISLFGDEDMTRLTQTNLVMGTLCYMSPEQQSQPKEVDARSDIYSLGTILYEIFTGTKPVGRFEDPSKMNPAFPRDLERVILRCLEVQRENRYEDVATLRERLAQLWEDGLFHENAERELLSFDDRIGYWLQIWREGTTKQRLEARSMMISQVRPGDASRFVELFKISSREDRLVLIALMARCPEPDVTGPLIQALEDPMLGREKANEPVCIPKVAL